MVEGTIDVSYYIKIKLFKHVCIERGFGTDAQIMVDL